MRDAAPETLVALGTSKEVDDLGQLPLGLIDAGHVVERDTDFFRVDPASARPAEVAEGPHPSLRRAPCEQHEQTHDEQRWPESEQQLNEQRGALRRRLCIDHDALFFE